MMESKKLFTPENFEPGKNYVLEASAGTGKTYNIVEIVKKLIHSKKIDLHQLLLVTYTEKAAGELKDRIKSGLEDEVSPEEIDTASIGTIHSFCQKTIEEFCISTGKPSSLTLIDEEKSCDFIDQFMREGELYKDIVKLKSIDPSQKVEEKLKKMLLALMKYYYLDGDGNEVCKIVKLEPINPTDTFDDVIDDTKSEIKYLADKCSLYEAFPTLQADLDVLNNSTIEKARNLAKLLSEDIEASIDGRTFNDNFLNSLTPDESKAYEDICECRSSLRIAKAKIKEAIKKLAVKYGKDVYKAWQKKKEENTQQTYNDMLRNVREEVVKPGSALLKKLKRKYKYAIIDEFQDTNQIQWDIFKSIFMDEDGDHNIIVVGDPKQSIYAFQGADLNVYRAATEEIVKKGGEKQLLFVNYRSTPDMIKCINSFFLQPEADPTLASTTDSASPSDFFESEKPDSDKFAVQFDEKDTKAFWIQTDEGDNYPRLVCQTILDCCTYKDGKTRLRLWKKDKDWDNVSFGDFAILARTRSELKSIKDAMEKCGIPYVQYKENSLLNGYESACWEAVLDAIDSPDFSGKKRAKFRRALHTAFFGKTIEGVSSPYYDKDNIKEIQLFDKWRELAKEKSWEALIDSIIDDTGIEDRLAASKHIRTIGAIRQIGEYCISYLTNNQSLKLLVKNLRKHLDDINDEESAQESENIVAKGTDFDCVKVMTIHASKGLEYPVVISAAGSKGPLKSHLIDIFGYHDSIGEYTLAFSDNASYWNEICAEWKRLIYVAYTRAKYLLILPNYKTPKDSFPFIENSIKGYVKNYPESYKELTCDNRDMKVLEAVSNSILSGKSEGKKGVEEAGSKPSSSLNITKEEQKGKIKELKDKKGGRCSYKRAYSSLSHGKQKEETMTDDALTVDNEEAKVKEPEREDLSGFDQNNVVPIKCEYDESRKPVEISKDFPAGADLGNALHDIFEVIDYKKAAAMAASEPDDDLDACIENCLKAYGIKCPDTWKKDIREMIRNVLNAKLPGIQGGKGIPEESFTLGEIDWQDRKNEVEFNFRYDDAVVNYFNGFVDLIIKSGDYYSVLDWKSDRIKEGSEFTAYNKTDEVQKHVDSLYSIQRVLYSYTLIKWLKNFYPHLTEQKIFEQHFGGVYYVFLRGCNEGSGNGIYAQTWKSWQDIEDAYKDIVQKRIFGTKDEKTDPGKTGAEMKGKTKAKEAEHE